jgi:hypothetical protein
LLEAPAHGTRTVAVAGELVATIAAKLDARPLGAVRSGHSAASDLIESDKDDCNDPNEDRGDER